MCNKYLTIGNTIFHCQLEHTIFNPMALHTHHACTFTDELDQVVTVQWATPMEYRDIKYIQVY